VSQQPRKEEERGREPCSRGTGARHQRCLQKVELGGSCILLWGFGLQKTLPPHRHVRWQGQRWDGDVTRMVGLRRNMG